MIKKRPDLLVYQSFDIETNQPLELGKQILFNESIQFPIMLQFLDTYALPQKRAGLVPRKTTPYLEVFTETQFMHDVLQNEKAVVVFFTTSRNLIEKQTPIFEKLREKVGNAIVICVFYMRGTKHADNTEEYIHNLKQKLRLTAKPLQARFYKNSYYGESKDLKSVEIDLGSFEGTIGEMNRIME